MTRIISWNVNGIRAAHKKGFMEWMYKEDADIVCVQESKAMEEQVPKDLQAPEGYTPIWHSAERKGYSGTASFVKKEPLNVFTLGVDEFDVEGRTQALEYKNFILINAYFPNSRPERARLPYKIDFCNAMQDFLLELVGKGKNIVLVGDYNIAHTEIDLARPKDNANNPGFYKEEREAMTKFLGAGFVDTFRMFTKEGGHYTWWSYRARARERNVGWRIDYACVNESFQKKVKKAYHLPNVMGSDHCPVVIELKNR